MTPEDSRQLPRLFACEACDPPCEPGSLPTEPTERLATLERLWQSAVDRGLVWPVPCEGDEGDEHEIEAPADRGCCEGHGWTWQWAPSPTKPLRAPHCAECGRRVRRFEGAWWCEVHRDLGTVKFVEVAPGV